MVWCRCGFIRPIRFTCRWSYRFNELSPLPLSFSLSFSLWHTIFPQRRVSRRLIWHVSIASNGSVVPEERSLPGIPSITTLEFRRSTSDRNTTGQSRKSTDFRDRVIKRRYLPRESGRKWGENSREKRPPVTCSKACAVSVFASWSAKILRERAKCLPKGPERSQSSQRSESEIRIPAGTFDRGR